ncbi:uncharacterized protein LOC120354524 [Nilaparvata lugens]|uniref:uncharacterized protein LOC120354524 n=1 Tax=Nilaparvata lugens TaxID=108931 RepID=UPI00193DBA13|nr:uncharacterized protein LOC120354524 [Nilaparvata lugens]
MWNDDKKLIACAAAYYVVCTGEYLKRRMRRKKHWWVDSYNKSRKRYNATDMLVDLKKEPSGRFHNFCRMDATDFESLLSRIAQTLIKKDTNMRKNIPAQERLAVALRFFASGDSYGSLSFLFKISKQTISKCVDKVCKALIEELKEEIQVIFL